MAYSYGSAAINFPPEGEYVTLKSESINSTPVPSGQTIVLGTSVNNLPAFPTTENQGITELPELTGNDYFPIVNVEGATSFAYKVTLGQVKDFISKEIGVSPIGGNLSLGGGLILDEEQFIKWEYDIAPLTYTFGISFNRTSGFKFRDFDEQHNIFKVDPDGVLVLAALETTLGGQPTVATAGGLHYWNGNLYFGK